MSVLIRNGRWVDGVTDATRDVLIDGETLRVDASIDAKGHEVIDASGMVVMPGMIDLRAHLREPGQEYKEDIASGATAALAGGVTTVVAQPDTTPTIDNGEIVDFVRRRGEQAGRARVLVAGAISEGTKGEKLASVGEMRRAGAVALSDGDRWLRDAGLMRRALEYASDFGFVVMSHCEDPALSRDGHMHEGAMSVRLGLKGIPSIAEETAVARDIALAAYTKARLHVAHVSSAGAVELVRRAKASGVRVTCDVAMHQLLLTHEALAKYDSNLRLNPPLRQTGDRDALIAGVKDGTIDAIASDHAPQSVLEKDLPFHEAHVGAIGLQTMASHMLALSEKVPMSALVQRLTRGPASVLGLAATSDVTVIDPRAEWSLARSSLLSKQTNSPFFGQTLRGRVEVTVVRGRVVYKYGSGS